MSLNPQIIIPILTAGTAVILLCAGGRLLRPAVGLAAGLFGGGYGLLLAPSLSIGISPLLIALICAIIAAVIAVTIAKFAILITLGVGFALIAPVVTWYAVGLGDGQAVLENVIDAATTNDTSDSSVSQSEKTEQTDINTARALRIAFSMLTEHAGEVLRDGYQRANAAMGSIPNGYKFMMIGSAIIGLLLGLFVATFMPHFSASLVTSSLGSVLMVEAIRNGAAILWTQHDFATISPSVLLVLYSGLAIAGLGLQLTLFRRRPSIATPRA